MQDVRSDGSAQRKRAETKSNVQAVSPCWSLAGWLGLLQQARVAAVTDRCACVCGWRVLCEREGQ